MVYVFEFSLQIALWQFGEYGVQVSSVGRDGVCIGDLMDIGRLKEVGQRLVANLQAIVVRHSRFESCQPEEFHF